ncbi:MAG: carbohydrate-binding domain-containing protein [Candidatus Eisenbacteria bacterium]
MRSRPLLVLALLAWGITLWSCSESDSPAAPVVDDDGTDTPSDDPSDTPSDSPSTSDTLEEALAANASVLADPGDGWQSDVLHPITFGGSTVTTDASGVTWDGETLTITEAGSFELSGVLDDGRIVVDAEDQGQVTLVLAGLHAHSSQGSPLSIAGADLTLLYLASNASNTLSDASEYVFDDSEDDEPDAALFSADDLVIAGAGQLTVVGSYNDGISSKDRLLILGGDIDVTAVDDGVRGKESVALLGGTLDIDAGGDGVKSDQDDDDAEGFVYVAGGTLRLASGDDGIQAETDILVGAGSVDIESGGGHSTSSGDESAKGLKANVSIILGDGAVSIDASDDGVNCDGEVLIDGGTLSIASGDDGIKSDLRVEVRGGVTEISDAVEGIEAPAILVEGGELHAEASDDVLNSTYGYDGESDDGSSLTIAGGYVYAASVRGDCIDSNGDFTVSGGTLVVHGPRSQPEVAIDVNGTFTVQGGFLIASAVASNMTETPSSASGQTTLVLRASQSLSAGTLFHIEDADGTSLLTFAPERSYSAVTFSSPALANGASYRIYTGGSCTGEVVDGLYEGGSYSGGTLRTTVTVSRVAQSVSF